MPAECPADFETASEGGMHRWLHSGTLPQTTPGTSPRRLAVSFSDRSWLIQWTTTTRSEFLDLMRYGE